MKSRIDRKIVFALAAFLCSAAASRALDGAWAGALAGSWTNAANWAAGEVPGGAGAVVSFPFASNNNNLTATLDAPFTIGKFVVNASGNYWNIAAGENGSLTLDNGGDMPEIYMDVQSGNGSHVHIKAPLRGNSGLLIHTADGKKPHINFHAPGDISGVIAISNELNCYVYCSGVFGAAVINKTGKGTLSLNEGVAFSNNIVIGGGTVMTANMTQNANPGAVALSGAITLAGGGTLTSGSPLFPLHVNGPVSGAGDITFRAGVDDAQIFLNAPLSIESGRVGVLSNPLLHLNAPLAWDESRAFNLQGGAVRCHAANVFDTAAPIDFSPWETGNQALDLNGFSQRVGGIMNGAWNVTKTVFSCVTSAAPATLTLDVAQGATRNMRYHFRIGGALDIVKKGLGTQQFNNAVSTNIVDCWVVEEGAMQFNAGLFSANATVCGGSLSGAGRLLWRLGGETPDAMALESGSLNIANMPVVFDGVPDYGEHLVLDAAPDAQFTHANTQTAPFLSVEGLPEDCRLRISADKRRVWLVRGLPGTQIFIR